MTSRRRLVFLTGVAVVAGVVLAWGPIQAARARSILGDLRSSDTDRQRGARDAIHHFPPYSARAAAVFGSALSDPDWGVRQAAATALANLGGLSAAEVPELVTCLADPDDRVRASAAVALGSIGPDAAGSEAALRDLLASRLQRGHADHTPLQYSWLPPLQAAWALGEIGTRSPATIETLERARRDNDEQLSVAADRALKRLGVH